MESARGMVGSIDSHVESSPYTDPTDSRSALHEHSRRSPSPTSRRKASPTRTSSRSTGATKSIKKISQRNSTSLDEDFHLLKLAVASRRKPSPEVSPHAEELTLESVSTLPPLSARQGCTLPAIIHPQDNEVRGKKAESGRGKFPLAPVPDEDNDPFEPEESADADTSESPPDGNVPFAKEPAEDDRIPQNAARDIPITSAGKPVSKRNKHRKSLVKKNAVVPTSDAEPTMPVPKTKSVPHIEKQRSKNGMMRMLWRIQDALVRKLSGGDAKGIHHGLILDVQSNPKKVILLHSRGQLNWDFFIFWLTMYQVTVYPFQACFDISFSWAFYAWDLLTDIIFWVFIVLNFFTAYESGGTVVCNKSMIRKHYLKGYFIVDVLASFPTDIVALTSIGWRPYLRLNRFIRVVRISYYFYKWERSATHLNPYFVRIIKLVFVFLVTAHWVACLWFLLIRLEGTPVNVDFATDATILVQDPGAQWLRAMYWASISLTGYGNTIPTNDLETALSLVVVLIGVSVYVTVIGTVGSLVTNLDTSANLFREKMSQINDYMRYRRLPADLKRRVRDYYSYMWKSRKGLDESTVLNDLPPYLRVEISLAQYRHLIDKVPLFKDADANLIASIVLKLQARVSLPGYYLFRRGDVGKEMFFISRGRVEVMSPDESTQIAVLEAGDFFGEGALTSKTGRRGASIRAATYCDLFVLTKDDLDEVLQEFPDTMKLIQSKAMQRNEVKRKDTLTRVQLQESRSSIQPQQNED